MSALEHSQARERAPRTPVRLIVHGARGRMGSRIAELALLDERFEVVAQIDRDETSPPAPVADAIIDFSSPEGAVEAAALAAAQRVALVVGTTGLSPDQHALVRAAARSAPVLICANTSLGVAVLRHLVRTAARLLPGFEIDIVESHHIRKKDAPSGTALALAAAAREGGNGPSPERIHALRGGDIIGEHIVQFAGPGETIRLEHTAVSRDLFALGALRAAAWLAGKPPREYTIEDSLELS